MSEAIRTRARELGLPDYFDMQAELGHTKHLGGWFATTELLDKCDLIPGQEILYVGCGAGTSAVKIATEFDCRLVGVDVLETMVEAAKNWATHKGAEDLVEFEVADAQDLPFEDNRFDVVLSESVNTFIHDLERAASEYVRVTRPGGYVGMNEAIWVKTPTETARETMEQITGQHLRDPDEWVSMLKLAGLVDVTGQEFEIRMRQESRDQLAFLSIRDYMRILARFFKSFLFDPNSRNLLKVAFSEPRSIYDSLGYGLFVGRKPFS